MLSLLVVLMPQAAVPAVYRVGGGVTAPRLESKAEPEYSEIARKAKIQGTTVLSVFVGPDGRAHTIRIQRPGPDAGLDREAIRAVEQWRFSPGMKEGKPVTVVAAIEVNFRLLKTEPNSKLSAKVYRADAKKGNADAQYGLGVVAYDERKFDEARNWFEQAAAQGLCQAEYRLGTLYEKGEGVAQDKDIALQWFKKSAAHTDYHLGVMLYPPPKLEK